MNQELDWLVDTILKLPVPERRSLIWGYSNRDSIRAHLRSLQADDPAVFQDIRSRAMRAGAAARPSSGPTAPPAPSPGTTARAKDDPAGAPGRRARRTPSPAAPQPSPAPPQGDHVDFRHGTFYGPVSGAEHHYYNGGERPARSDPAGWPTLADADPIALGVRRTRRFDGESRLPPYVAREADAGLAERVRAGGPVVVTGEPLAGKSRTAWEALRAVLPPTARVYAPSPGADLSGLPDAVRGRPGRYALWLDELDGYLGEHGLDAGLLAQLAALRVPVVATMSDEAYDKHRFGGGRASKALGGVPTVDLPRHWTGTELTALAGAGDPRLRDALERRGDCGVTEYLAVAPELWDVWRRADRAHRAGGHPLGHLLVRAAVDAARCGISGPVPEGMISEILEAYETEGSEPDWESDDEALAWATEKRHGVAALLEKHEDESMSAFGSLIADTEAAPGPPEIPVPVWLVVTEHAVPEDDEPFPAAVSRAMRAYYTPRAEAGDGEAMAMLGALARNENDRAGALHWLRMAAGSEIRDAQMACVVLCGLGELLVEAGEHDEAARHLRRAAEWGDADAAYDLSRLMRDRADHWLRQAADAGHTTAKAELAGGAEPDGSEAPDSTHVDTV
ncbi:sel1 repeat family protein [Streptomyces sp. L2]|uniref:sel1 repeat family protein n=1 Tax=Streptomyces sp. L2 TaxID=2162665 RepID=UPI0010102ABD|nr:sel1 repeat family protein [Streptomyces sp. L2]